MRDAWIAQAKRVSEYEAAEWNVWSAVLHAFVDAGLIENRLGTWVPTNPLVGPSAPGGRAGNSAPARTPVATSGNSPVCSPIDGGFVR